VTASCTVTMQQLIASKQRLAQPVPRLQGCEEQAEAAGGGGLPLQRNDPVVSQVFAHYGLHPTPYTLSPQGKTLGRKS
jgi:hypothetical protein